MANAKPAGPGTKAPKEAPKEAPKDSDVLSKFARKLPNGTVIYNFV